MLVLHKRAASYTEAGYFCSEIYIIVLQIGLQLQCRPYLSYAVRTVYHTLYYNCGPDPAPREEATFGRG